MAELAGAGTFEVSACDLFGGTLGAGDCVFLGSTVTVELGGFGDIVGLLRLSCGSDFSTTGTELELDVEPLIGVFPLGRTSCPEDPALTIARCRPSASSSTSTPGVVVGVGAEGGLIFIRRGPVAVS